MKRFLMLAATLAAFQVAFTGCSSKEKDNSTPTPSTPGAPVANFTFTGDNVPYPATVSFTNSSTNASSYTWDFGDGGSSTDGNPQHVYNSSGTFTVKLTATGAGGTGSVSKSLTIKDIPTTCQIDSLKILAMPFTNMSGGSWDPTNGPDVYFNITDIFGNILLNGATFKYDNINASYLPLKWGFAMPFNFTPLATTRRIVVMDYDAPAADEIIDNLPFRPDSSVTGYPATAQVTNGNTTVELTLSWQ